jgi:hypothetical protein
MRRIARGPWWSRFSRDKQKEESIDPRGCWCGVCFGRGTVEGATFKIRNYFPFFFALVIVSGAFVIFAIEIFHNKSVSASLETALTTILGTIVGFYFGGKKSEE